MPIFKTNRFFSYYLPIILTVILITAGFLAYSLINQSQTAQAAVSQTGTNTEFNISNAGSGTVSSTITVPTDATLIIAGISGYHSSQVFSNGSMTFTKGGVDTAMTAVQPSTSGDLPGAFMAAMFYQVLPDTGSNKTLKWSWANGPVVNAPIISITFWKGVDTTNPVRGSGGGQNSGLPYTTNTITAQSGDTIVAWAGGYVGSGDSTIDSWSNANTLAQVTLYGSADGAWATGSPSGDTTVSANTYTGDFRDGGIVAISLIPAPAAPKIKMRAAGNSGSIKIHGGSSGGGGSVTMVQIKQGGSNFGATSANVTFDSTVGSGNGVVACVQWTANIGTGHTPISSLSDDKSNSYTALTAQSRTATNYDYVDVQCFYTLNVTNGPITITANWSQSVAASIYLAEFTAGIYDQSTGTTGNSTNPSAGALTPSGSGEFGMAIYLVDNGLGSNNTTAGSGWTLIGSPDGGGSQENAAEYQNISGPGSITGDFGQPNGGPWVATMLLFKSNGGASGGSVKFR